LPSNPGASAWFIDATFGVAFLAASLLVLPPLVLVVWRTSSSRASGLSGALVLVYAGVAKWWLLPSLIAVLHRFLPA
jgi:hypothetical protein